MNAPTPLTAPATKVLMLITSDFVRARYDALRQRAPQLEIVTDLPPGTHDDIHALLAFKLPAGIASRLPKLQLAASVGAGADGILSAPDLAPQVKVTRAVEPGLGFSMAQFVALQILRHFRLLPALEKQQAASRWQRLPVPDASCATVGIMGLGAIGSVVAQALMALGFRVIGWTRSSKPEAHMPVFAGEAHMGEFLAQCQYLVCLLPSTADTAGLLDARRLAQLPQGAYVVNVARGGILVEDDLLTLIDSGHLAGAALDVFAVEPLPADNRLWQHPRILVTPHVAAQPSVAPVVEQFLDNLGRLERGEPLLHEVDRRLGY